VRLTLRQLQIFTAVADTGSTTAAGLHVALSQSATSSALSELESLLNTRLFDRIGKRLVLNDTGRTMLPHARALLDSAQDIESQFVGGFESDRGMGIVTKLRIGASTTIGNYLLPALIARQARTSLDTGVSIVIGNTSEVAAAVARLEVDVGFIEGPCHEPELEVRPWREDELVLVCAPSHALVQDHLRMKVGLAALQQQRWLLREPGSGTREAVESVLLPHLHQWTHTMQLGSTEAIKQSAAEGLGLTCLSRCAVQDLITLRRLVIVNTTLPRLTRRFHLIHHRRKQVSPCLQRFIAHCEST
jgi:DNA-binding transcriptional LysR family regulator